MVTGWKKRNAGLYRIQSPILSFSIPVGAAMTKRSTLYTVGCGEGEDQEALKEKGISLTICKPPTRQWVFLDLHQLCRWHKSEE